MARFYGTVQGNRGTATRMGSKHMETYCASWDGAIKCYAYIDGAGRDCVKVEKTTWHGKGENKLLYNGVIGKEKLDG